eukprot:gnl/Dysnectes_brevis/1753_a2000_1008.p1 GENE.gnl/Dysnectes_brevis/1753_a2000_1008~~gnl/Dysnectes_brevis/1753_a2000_1008.p1  ORF type:complete len:432 (-),score=148.76 gnl/Dysnectes_brevis/1753_a2000_1008:86-1381(-)
MTETATFTIEDVQQTIRSFTSSTVQITSLLAILNHQSNLCSLETILSAAVPFLSTSQYDALHSVLSFPPHSQLEPNHTHSVASLLFIIKSFQQSTNSLWIAEVIFRALQQPVQSHLLAGRAAHHAALTLVDHSETMENAIPKLASALRAAQADKAAETQAALINGILRACLLQGHFEQAHSLTQAIALPEEAELSNGQLGRMLYYRGRVAAARGEYEQARQLLLRGMGLAPAHARGFQVHIFRPLVLVRLLLGRVTPVSEFRPFGDAVLPYFELCAAARQRGYKGLEAAVQAHALALRADGLLELARRAQSSAVVVGLRRTARVFSRIALKDLAVKLGLPDAESAHVALAEAVRKGLLKAEVRGDVVVFPKMQCHYATGVPRETFLGFSTEMRQIRAAAIRALRYEGKGTEAEVGPVDTALDTTLEDESME